MTTSTRDFQRAARDIANQCIARRARLLGRKLTRLYDDALRPAGLTSGQLNILVAVGLHPGSRASELHRRLDLEQSSFSRNAALMERKGWIEKQPSDGRSHVLVLTRAGRALLVDALPLWRAAQRDANRLLGSDAQTFADLVDNVC